MTPEYVIYCRKSTDEKSGMQTQSIPDQIKKCVKYAKDNKLPIAKKLEDFSMFESEIEIKREDLESDIENRRIFKDTRDLFIVKEQCTAKIPWMRPKRKKLIKMIEQGKIKWLLSYSPDRQARNMVEGWILIDCVDRELVDLKYTNFHFEPTASGKMMLGIWFVFSKQYSDKLSEDISRGNQSKKDRWKSLGKFKYWYIEDEEMYYRPHPKYFDLMRRAFEMKIYENKSDDSIANWLNANGFKREQKNWIKKAVKSKRLWDVWRNQFYYGMFVSKEAYYDLRELNPYFEPIISEEEYDLLQERLKKRSKERTKEVKDENQELYPVETNILTAPDGKSFTCSIPNINTRHKKNLKELKKTKKNATLADDIIKSNQIYFDIKHKDSKYKWLSIKFDEIEKQIVKFLEKMKVDDDAYDQFVDFAKNQADTINDKKRTESNKIQIRLNKLSSKRKEYIKKHMGKDLDQEEQKIYKEELEKFDIEIDVLEKEQRENTISERNELLELTVFLDMMRKASRYYKKVGYVQKREISKILFSNITISNKKRLTIKVNPNFESFFSDHLKVAGVEPASERHWQQYLPL